MSSLANALLLLAPALLIVGCDRVAAPPTSAPSALLAGWYSQDATQAMLQPCGADLQLRVIDGDQLREQARAFGLGNGDPVYVKVEGVREAGRFTLRRVAQFGSPTPRNGVRFISRGIEPAPSNPQRERR